MVRKRTTPPEERDRFIENYKNNYVRGREVQINSYEDYQKTLIKYGMPVNEFSDKQKAFFDRVAVKLYGKDFLKTDVKMLYKPIKAKSIKGKEYIKYRDLRTGRYAKDPNKPIIIRRPKYYEQKDYKLGKVKEQTVYAYAQNVNYKGKKVLKYRDKKGRFVKIR